MYPTIPQNKTPRGFSTFHVQDSVHPITAPAPKAVLPHSWEEAHSSNLPLPVGLHREIISRHF